MIYYYDNPITIQDIKRILNESKVINIEDKEPFPEGKVTFVGVGNDSYECKTLWDMKYTNHMKLAYGGYFNEDHSGYNAWWTMNYNYSDKYDKKKVYIVNNAEDGHKLAKFLNFIGGFNNLDNIIEKKKKELENIKSDLEYLLEAKNNFNDHNSNIPTNLDEAIKELDKELNEDDKKYLLENGALSVHHSLGRWIRNTWNLWNDESKLKTYMKNIGYIHPDDISNYIIETFIDYLKK